MTKDVLTMILMLATVAGLIIVLAILSPLQAQPRYIYDAQGQPQGFEQNGYTFDQQGQYSGFVQNEQVYDEQGQWDGYLVDDYQFGRQGQYRGERR